MLSTQRAILLGPDRVARTVARMRQDPMERWMLCQPRDVRESYVFEVLDRRGVPNAEQIWMLRQPDAVRTSYIREVLE